MGPVDWNGTQLELALQIVQLQTLLQYPVLALSRMVHTLDILPLAVSREFRPRISLQRKDNRQMLYTAAKEARGRKVDAIH